MFIVLDFETSGLNFWEPDFRVHSMALAWRDDRGIQSWYSEDPVAIERALWKASKQQIVVHNASFEGGIFAYKYPHIPLKIEIDTLRLVQQFDAGGPGNQLSLKDSAKRILGKDKGDWEKPVYEWIKENIADPAAKKTPGAFLSQVPSNMLREYNLKDVERTYELLEHILVRLPPGSYQQDMFLYLYMCDKFAHAKAHGIPVDRVPLAAYVTELTGKIQAIDEKFLEFFKDAVKDVRGILHQKAQSMFKRKIVEKIPEMNPGSTRHLEYLFCEVLKMQPRITTPKGRPCFKTKYLAQWGDGGQILAGRSKAQFTRAQSLALLDKSSGMDGRWHPDLSPGTTVTGRNKTYGGLNVLALDRRDKGFMQTLLSDPAQTLVSVDLAAGEPSVVANFSGDFYYRYATVDGVGKTPSYDRNGVLMVDDIYMMLMSQTPMGRDVLKKDFSPQWAADWVVDADAVKGRYKKLRQLHKVAALGFSYGMGPKKLQRTLFENGYDFEEDACKQMYYAYWGLFSDVKAFADSLTECWERNKVILNPFGFRCLPQSGRLAFNYFCQSTVNGLMGVLTMKVESAAPYARLITTIHDENIYSIPLSAVSEFKRQVEHAVKDLNDTLNWSVPIRTGFATGRNFYEAK